MSYERYFDTTTTVEVHAVEDVPSVIASATQNTENPMARYAKTLSSLRKRSPQIANEYDQVMFAREFGQGLADLAGELGLPDTHFSVDTSGDPLLVKERGGQHWVMPTNFEAGSYFSTPHADHQYYMTASELPKISIGKYVKFGKGAGVNAGGDVTIGDGAWLSPGSLLLRQDHTAYGRPSVASRTVAMTRQPGITLGKQAWVGRDAMVGWNCDYIGDGGIVGTRSFVNTWVGDHSIVGDHCKILQYQPYKAYVGQDMTLVESLRISDWDAINDHWQGVYARNVASQFNDGYPADFSEWLDESINRRSRRALVLNPSDLDFLPMLSGFAVDIVKSDSALDPYVLQWASDRRLRSIRLRTESAPLQRLPFETAGIHLLNKEVGYDVIIADGKHGTEQANLLEMERVLRAGGLLIAGGVFDEADIDSSESLVEVRTTRHRSRSIRVLEKK